jgi:hypothetical protein
MDTRSRGPRRHDHGRVTPDLAVVPRVPSMLTWEGTRGAGTVPPAESAVRRLALGSPLGVLPL